jgi:hypothetical protein
VIWGFSFKIFSRYIPGLVNWRRMAIIRGQIVGRKV